MPLVFGTYWQNTSWSAGLPTAAAAAAVRQHPINIRPARGLGLIHATCHTRAPGNNMARAASTIIASTTGHQQHPGKKLYTAGTCLTIPVAPGTTLLVRLYLTCHELFYALPCSRVFADSMVVCCLCCRVLIACPTCVLTCLWLPVGAWLRVWRREMRQRRIQHCSNSSSSTQYSPRFCPAYTHLVTN